MSWLSLKVTAPPEIYTLSLHDALPILTAADAPVSLRLPARFRLPPAWVKFWPTPASSVSALVGAAEHTPELQSRFAAGCRLVPAYTFTVPAPVLTRLAASVRGPPLSGS